MKKFTVEAHDQGRYVRQDHDTAEAAIAHVERIGKGSVTSFYGTRNLPHCLPEIVYHATNLWSFNTSGDGKWWGHYIFDGRGDKVNEDRPH